MAKTIEYTIFDGIEEIAKGEIVVINKELYEPEELPKKLIEECLKIDENNKEIEIEDKFFGERNEKLVETFRISDLNVNENELTIGNYVKIGNYFGMIKSVSSGRVQIDFNHPYAGKILKVKMKLEKILEEKKQILEEVLKVKDILKNIENFEINEKLLKIEMKTNVNLELDKNFLDKVKKALNIEKIKIIFNY
ncbi:MAG: hypothetical protein RMJ17_02360 [Candidatus Aenigmarchaeota archaeon]|nr:hypothetical protein [Candidatus Aenigmarchaeota archaeon]MDW8149415.1 hypothetical protein [Candidatus Aenigmarchaeota archaeon]